MCDIGYLFANFSLPRHLCSRHVRDRQTSGTHNRLMPPTLKAGHNKLCVWRHNMPPPPESWQYLRIYSPGPVPACWLFKTSATSWPLTFWPSKWCPSHVWRGLPLCQF